MRRRACSRRRRTSRDRMPHSSSRARRPSCARAATTGRRACSRVSRGSTTTARGRRWRWWPKRRSGSAPFPKRARITAAPGRARGGGGAAAVGVALAALPAATPSELVALARAMKGHGGASDARVFVERAVRLGDSSAATLLLLGELQVGAGRYRDAERAYRAAAKDSLVGPLAIYRRARLLVRLGDPGADEALAGFAQTYPADTAAPTALYLIGDMRGERGDAAGAARWFGELIARYPVDPRSSVARFRLAFEAARRGLLDSAAALYQSEVTAGAPQRMGARFWLGKLALQRGDTAAARAMWLSLARDDSIGYYGLRARRETGSPPLAFAAATPPPVPPGAASALRRLDTLMLASRPSPAQPQARRRLA